MKLVLYLPASTNCDVLRYIHRYGAPRRATRPRRLSGQVSNRGDRRFVRSARVQREGQREREREREPWHTTGENTETGSGPCAPNLNARAPQSNASSPSLSITTRASHRSVGSCSLSAYQEVQIPLVCGILHSKVNYEVETDGCSTKLLTHRPSV